MITGLKIKLLSVSLTFLIMSFLNVGCKKDEKPTGPVIDFEGNSYNTVKIGTQIWMTENLKSTKYNDGSEIQLITPVNSWSNLSTGAYCWYNNDEASFKNVYGALYNGYSVATGKLCPSGWHIPEIDELKVLRDFLGDSLQAGGKLKESGTTHWLSPNKGATNSSGFTALPTGIRYFEGTFASNLSYTSIWSATNISYDSHNNHYYHDEQWYVSLYYANASFLMDHRSKKHGFSVRCMKD
jgi:uncharacterized protein (TIGR02145 family)